MVHAGADLEGRRIETNVEVDDAKRLTVSNIASGTASEASEQVFHGRLSLFDVSADGFKLEEEISTDVGKTWFLVGKATYTRTEK